MSEDSKSGTSWFAGHQIRYFLICRAPNQVLPDLQGTKSGTSWFAGHQIRGYPDMHEANQGVSWYAKNHIRATRARMTGWCSQISDSPSQSSQASHFLPCMLFKKCQIRVRPDLLWQKLQIRVLPDIHSDLPQTPWYVMPLPKYSYHIRYFFGISGTKTVKYALIYKIDQVL
jgi:hypothetical protein